MNLASQEFDCLIIVSNFLGDKDSSFNTLSIQVFLVLDLDYVSTEDTIVSRIDRDTDFPVERYRAVFSCFLISVFDSSIQFLL
jgi:hypothetical protein